MLWYLTVYRSFAAYIPASFFTHVNWWTVLYHTFVPQLRFDFASISSAVALLGATISPYSMFWQAQAETEEKRVGSLRQQLRMAWRRARNEAGEEKDIMVGLG